MALAAFVAAAVLGILCSWPRPHKEGDTAALKALIDEKWGEPAERGARRAALLRWEVLHQLREVNKTKASFLVVALWFEIAALVLLAIAVVVTLAA